MPKAYSRHVRITDPELVEAIEKKLKSDTKYTFSSLTRDALNEYLTKEEDDSRILWRRLSRQDRLIMDLRDRYDILVESFSMFVRYYFLTTEEIPEENDHAQTLQTQSRKRWVKYMDAIRERLVNHGSMVEGIVSMANKDVQSEVQQIREEQAEDE